MYGLEPVCGIDDGPLGARAGSFRCGRQTRENASDPRVALAAVVGST
ncbi:hypothetical protein [Natronobacterium gregoryi]|nr:hypothetical protein [Natronobacterium gregoryi]